MNIISIAAPLIVPFIQLYVLFRIWRELKIISLDAERKEELKRDIKKFGEMFAAASGVPMPPKNYKKKSDDDG
ncbi:MAG: hypothetical protein ACRENK_11820 [Gemmatimonadaceae bacterium]